MVCYGILNLKPWELRKISWEEFRIMYAGIKLRQTFEYRMLLAAVYNNFSKSYKSPEQIIPLPILGEDESGGHIASTPNMVRELERRGYTSDDWEAVERKDLRALFNLVLWGLWGNQPKGQTIEGNKKRISQICKKYKICLVKS